MADALDSKSSIRKSVWVQVPPPVLFSPMILDPNRVTLGSWCQIGHPANAGILAKVGFEWLAADCEHGEFEEGGIANFCRAVRQFDCSPLVRVRENAVLPIRRALDLGAAGAIVPMVNSSAAAEAAARAANYPPKGVRGFAWQDANCWGADFEDYARDFRPVVIAMIESRAAVEEVDAIMSVDGIHGCLLGPYDLSGSYGVPGETEHPLIMEASSKVVEACRRHGKSAGWHIVTPSADSVAQAVAAGFTLIALGMDTWFLRKGASEALKLYSHRDPG